MSIYINSETQNNRTKFRDLLLISLFIWIFAGFQTACFNSNQKTVAESRKDELEAKEKLKIQREESLKLFGTKIEEFVKFAPATKLATPPYLKGKTVIVDVRDPITDSFYYGYTLTEPELKLVYPGRSSISSVKEIWNKTFGVKSIAKNADDVQTVIQLKFTDTNVCRWYGVANDIAKQALLCGSKAEVTVIDKTIPAIIAKKTFTNNKLPKTVEVIEQYGISFPNDGYQMYPFNEIEEYLKNLEQK